MNNYCNNCGKQGHMYHQCKMPITSIGIIVFRHNMKSGQSGPNGNLEYLMIRRKDTLGYIDFMRGKYSIYNKEYILNMFHQMTQDEKEKLMHKNFDELWIDIWGSEAVINQYKVEEIVSREKFNSLKFGIMNKDDFYNIKTLVNDSNAIFTWNEPEWGFPKGRRNYQEKDYECALREFGEETGLNINKLKNLQNILPFEEIFTGSNYKSYKHKYFVSYMPYEDTLNVDNFEPTEVSMMEWKKYTDCIESIRSYNLEKKRLITNIHNTLTSCRLFCF